MRILYTLLAVVLMLSEVSFAQDSFDRMQEPQPGPAPTLKLPAIQRASLPNGLKLMVVEHHELPIVQLQMVVRTGADADPIGKAGIANMTASMLDEGTTSRTTLQIADEVDYIGAQLSTSASFDGSFANVLTTKEHLQKATEIFADVILHPSFPQSEFDRLQKELLTSILQQKDRPEIVANNVFYEKLYGIRHPYGSQSSGSETSVKGMSVEDLKSFYESFFVPDNATLIVVGDISKKEVQSLAEEYFGKWNGKNVPEKKFAESSENEETTLYLVDKPGAPQSQIRIGNVALERNSEDYYAASLLQQIIGSSNGKLYLNLREAKGYTYGAYAQFVMRRNRGPFLAYAGVRTDVTDSSMIEFMKEIRGMHDEVISEKEFDMYKKAVIQRIPRLFETPAQISAQLASLTLYNLQDDFFNTLVDRYVEISREDVLAVAKKYIHPEKLIIVVVGDKEKIMGKLAALGYDRIVECDTEGNKVQR